VTDAPASTAPASTVPASTVPSNTAPRRRDPERRQRILAAAAELVAERGYHEVGMSDIGAAAGIVGSGIYRHFDGKSAVLVAMLDGVIDDLARATAQILARGLEPAQTLRALIAAHVRIALDDRMLMRVYHNEIASLPADDNRRLRRKQRIYLEEWVHVLSLLRPGTDDAVLRALVHAGIGAVHSTLFYSSGLPAPRLATLMAAAAEAVMFIPDSGPDSAPGMGPDTAPGADAGPARLGPTRTRLER
jgi:AcrR family transcriptional regulator